jgi:Zn-dependent protease
MIKFIRTLAEQLLRILPALFWALLILGFDEVYVAVLTVASALLHELGHTAVLLAMRTETDMRAHLSGFRINCRRTLSYGEEMLAALGGPAANVAAAAVLLLFVRYSPVYILELAIINLLTAVSNLLPIEEHDGYRILECALLSLSVSPERASTALRAISFSLSALFTLFSLYLILRGDTGYWIFLIFMAILIKKIRSDKSVFSRENERKKEISRDFQSFIGD